MDYLYIFMLALIPLITYTTTIVVEKIESRAGLLGEDMHKKPGRFLPKSGGVGFLLGWSLSILMFVLISRMNGTPFIYEKEIFLGLALVLFSGAVGLYDDIRRLGGIQKVLLTAIPGIALALSGEFVPTIYIPTLGFLKMTIVYPIALPIIFAVASNAVNMSDTFTGIAPGITAILSIAMLLTIYITKFPSLFYGNDLGPSIIFLITAVLSLIGYLPRNFHPGKTFNGDAGSLAWGAILALGAIWGKVEFFLVLAAMPIITNGFIILASIKGIIEHHSLKERPTIPNRENNTLRANPKKNAPITLVHMLTLKEELCEREVVITVYLLVIFTSILSITIALLFRF
ncbi:MAG: hypothetical protein ACP5I2_00695 [Fervidicoccaceae archaeon]